MNIEWTGFSADRFEHLIQALMTAQFGYTVNIYGDGPDGQREAMIECADYSRYLISEVEGKTIIQAKFKSQTGGSVKSYAQMFAGSVNEVSQQERHRPITPTSASCSCTFCCPTGCRLHVSAARRRASGLSCRPGNSRPLSSAAGSLGSAVQ